MNLMECHRMAAMGSTGVGFGVIWERYSLQPCYWKSCRISRDTSLLKSSPTQSFKQGRNTCHSVKVTGGPMTTVLSTSLGKTLFAWRFNSNENILFWLTLSYQKPFVLYVSVFYSQIFTQKLKLRPKVGLAYAISLVKWFFLIFV